MSIPVLDYLPCDLTLYSQKVLPAWQAARRGDVQLLRELIDSADHLSYWPLFNIPNPLPGLFFAGPKRCLGWGYFDEDQPFWPQFFDFCHFTPTMLEPLPEGFIITFEDKAVLDFWYRRFATELRETLPQEFFISGELDFWQTCSRHLPALFDAAASTKPQTFLLGCLFYTFCCQIPGEVMADCIEIGNEDLHLWEDYMARTADIKALWEGFHAPAPQPLADQLLAPQTYQEYLASFDDEDRKNRLERALVEIGHDVMGFLDPEETVYLLDHLPTGERPDLDAIVNGCIRDRKTEMWPLSPELEALWNRIPYCWQTSEPGGESVPLGDREVLMAHLQRMQQRREERLRESIRDEQQIMEIYRRMCVYWNEACSELFQKNLNSYYQNIEHMETVILNRFRYAAERGWGMIELRA